MNVFISYPDEDLALAEVARLTFQGCAHTVWMFSRNRTPGAPTWREIAERIIAADVVLVICTSTTSQAEGQAREINIALNNNKWVPVVVVGDAAIPPELTGTNYNERVSTSQFQAHCEQFARDLPGIEQQFELVGRAESTDFRASLTDRARYIADLNARTEEMDADRITSCRQTIYASYLEATIPRQILAVRQVFEPAPSPDFTRIGLSLRRKLSEFSDPSCYWNLFCEELGRRVASGEQAYFHKSLVEHVPPAARAVSARSPDFDVLLEEIASLRATGFDPRAVVVPVQLLSAFYMRFANDLDWNARPGHKLSMPGGDVIILWSHAEAPLDRIVILNSSGAVWHVKPDSVTGHALWVGLGRFPPYPDEVEWIGETVVKLEFKDTDGFRAILVEGEPPDEYDMTRQ